MRIKTREGEFLTETDKDLCISDVVEHNGKHYVVCTKATDDSSCGVEMLEKLELDPYPREYEVPFVCPYCGYTDEDSWELDDGSEVECGFCGGTVQCEITITISYSTYPAKAPEVINIDGKGGGV